MSIPGAGPTASCPEAGITLGATQSPWWGRGPLGYTTALSVWGKSRQSRVAGRRGQSGKPWAQAYGQSSKARRPVKVHDCPLGVPVPEGVQP